MKLTVGDLCYLLDYSEEVEIVLDDKIIGPINYHHLGYVGYEIIGLHASKKGLLFLRCKYPSEYYEK